MPGDLVGGLHLWNEHLPRFPSGGPTLGWARRAHALMVHSLSLLADHVAWERQPLCRGSDFLEAITGLGAGGFEPALWRRTVWRSVHDVIESLLLGGLAYAYNSAASHRQRFLRHRQRIWIGRTTLIRLYGATGPLRR
jgi:hypothetical protein